MKKRIICTLMATVLCLSTGMTALAAPEIMSDGGVFDAEYYAETYPDVKAAFGDNKEALYNHYLSFGRTEGRVACRPAVDSPVKDATLVSAYETTWPGGGFVTETYSNGIKVLRCLRGHEGVDKKYWILRTDYSDGLLDSDGNGIDDRDPWNACGYTDLNYNGVIDGAPSLPYFIPESEMIKYHLCEHGVIDGWSICNAPECVAERERSSHCYVY